MLNLWGLFFYMLTYWKKTKSTNCYWWAEGVQNKSKREGHWWNVIIYITYKERRVDERAFGYIQRRLLGKLFSQSFFDYQPELNLLLQFNVFIGLFRVPQEIYFDFSLPRNNSNTNLSDLILLKTVLFAVTLSAFFVSVFYQLCLSLSF